MTKPSSDHAWSLQTTVPVLGEEDVHVWLASLDSNASHVARLAKILAADESRRAERFRFEKDRHHFIVGRGLLRTILAGYLGDDPATLRFKYGPQGKPDLEGDRSHQALRFNLSHSAGLALYAVTRDREVGVDIERLRPDMTEEKIAKRFFSTREVESLAEVPSTQRTQAFFNCWTRKEAFIKARGEGVSLPLDQFDVTLTPGEPAALLRTAYDPDDAARWSLHALSPSVGFAGAVAAEGTGWQLECWQWPAE